jgi:hypothetical protein
VKVILNILSWMGTLLFGLMAVSSLLAKLVGSDTGSTVEWLKIEGTLGVLFAVSLWGVSRSRKNRASGLDDARAVNKPFRAKVLIAAEIVIGVLTLLILLIGWGGWMASEARQDMKLAAIPVIAAIERYRDANATYPDSLSSLVPQYISALPRCRKHNPQSIMVYLREKETGQFELICPSFPFMRERYSARTKRWD